MVRSLDVFFYRYYTLARASRTAEACRMTFSLVGAAQRSAADSSAFRRVEGCTD